jgi:hypothetical protein
MDTPAVPPKVPASAVARGAVAAARRRDGPRLRSASRTDGARPIARLINPGVLGFLSSVRRPPPLAPLG